MKFVLLKLLTRDVSERVPDKILIFAFLLNFFLAFRRSAGTPYEIFFAFQRSAGTPYGIFFAFRRSAGTPYDFYSGSGVPPVPEPDFFSSFAFRRFRNGRNAIPERVPPVPIFSYNFSSYVFFSGCYKLTF